jgi:hypothetical protein
MDATESTILRDLRARIDTGEEFNSTLLARYQDLVAWEAWTAAGNIIPPHMYINIPLLFNETNTIASIIYLFSDSLNHCHRRSRYVVLFVRFLYIVTKPTFYLMIFSSDDRH